MLKKQEIDAEIFLKDEVYAYVDYMKRYEIPSLEEERELVSRVKENDKTAKDELVLRNWRLVIPFAKYYMSRGMSFMDLIQEGNVGLLTAVEYYEPNRGTKFSTYAVEWIKQSIRKSLTDTSHLIRVPTFARDEYNAKVKGYLDKCGENGEEVDWDGLAKKLINKLNPTRNDIDRVKQRLSSVAKIIGGNIVSIIYGKGEGGISAVKSAELTVNDQSYEESIGDDQKTKLYNICDYVFDRMKEECGNTINRVKMAERDIEMFKQKNGLYRYAEKRTYENVGFQNKLCRERVRQVCWEVRENLCKELLNRRERDNDKRIR